MKKIYITPFIHVKDIKVNCILTISNEGTGSANDDIPKDILDGKTNEGDGDDGNAKGGFIHFGFDE